MMFKTSSPVRSTGSRMGQNRVFCRRCQGVPGSLLRHDHTMFASLSKAVIRSQRCADPDRRWLAQILAGAIVALLSLPGLLRAQSTQVVGTASVKSGGLFAMPWEIDFQRLQDAWDHSNFELTQVRRVLDHRRSTRGRAGMVGVREKLIHGADQPGNPGGFRLEFLGPEGRKLPPALFRQRRRVHDAESGFLYDYQSFRVVDAVKAEKNYHIWFVGGKRRFGRLAYVLAVLPKLPGRSAWLLELDALSGVPLYRGEFSSQGHLVAEVVVKSFRLASSASSLKPKKGWWRSPVGIKEFVSPAACLSALGKVKTVVPSVSVFPSGYEFHTTHTNTHLFTGEKKAVIVYSDGIDQMFSWQGATKDLPLPGGHTISVYQDEGITQATFIHAGVFYCVSGRGTGGPTRETTKRLYEQAVATHR